MANSVVQVERRRALRVPVRGVAVFYTSGGPLHGMLENLSVEGAAITVNAASRPLEQSVINRPLERDLDLEIRLAEGSGWAAAQIVRVEPLPRQWRIAV